MEGGAGGASAAFFFLVFIFWALKKNDFFAQDLHPLKEEFTLGLAFRKIDVLETELLNIFERFDVETGGRGDWLQDNFLNNFRVELGSDTLPVSCNVLVKVEDVNLEM